MSFIGQRVQHKKFGEGIVTELSETKITVDFSGYITAFSYPDGFSGFLVAIDPVFDGAVKAAIAGKEAQKREAIKATEPDCDNAFSYKRTELRPTTNPLLGERSKTIDFASESEAYLVIGYLAAPYRISSIEAEIPMDGRHTEFEKLFPGQEYRPIMVSYTPSGMPNKLSSQFRINLANITNCPHVIRDNIGAGNGSCAARINKSRFVVTLVQKYGFQFGSYQDRNRIQQIAEQAGHLDDYLCGLNL